MPIRPTDLIHRLRHLAQPPVADSDADLLRRFSRLRDESAFAALVARHGPMVFGVCRRVLRDSHAAEDASQATFLVLARRAGSIERPDSLVGWLHGVAYRVASKARCGSRRRGRYESGWDGDRSEPVDARTDPQSEVSARELLEVLEGEVQRLSEAYRLPLVLCCLEGLSQEEAAQRLGCTPGSIRGRLERGRKRLHARLLRRGLALSTALAAVEATRGVASAALARTIVRGAVAFAAGGRGVLSSQVIVLTEGVLRAMFWSKMKVLLVVLVVGGLVGTGTSWLAIGAGKGDPPNAARAAGAERDAKAPSAAGTDKTAPKGKADEKEKEDRARAAREQVRAQRIDILLEEQAKKELALSEKIVEEKQKLVALEEARREVEADAREHRMPSEEELAIAKEVERLTGEIRGAKGNDKFVERLEKEKHEAAQGLRTWKERRQTERKTGTERLVEIRRSMVRKEETIRQLERNRELARNEIDRLRDVAFDLNRQREGSAAAEAPPGLPKNVAHRLDAIQRELTELRRELRNLKSGSKD